jgi:autotransporter-associated beta strand protein
MWGFETVIVGHRYRRLAALLLASTALVTLNRGAGATDAMWLQNPGSDDFNVGTNWTGGVLPDGTATFGASSQTAISLDPFTTVGGWTFNPGAPDYTFNIPGHMSFTGAGIVTNGANVTINLSNNGGNLSFQGVSTAGSAVINNNGSHIDFFNTSAAGNATVNNSGSIDFHDAGTAGSATITNSSGFTYFYDNSTAGNATIANSNGSTFFYNNGTAGDATIINESGNRTSFADNSTASNARLINNSGGTFDFSASSGPNNDHALSAGSIEGAGVFYLGANQLTVGGNNLSTTVSGIISDCGGGSDCAAGGAGGSLVKTGSGTLTLAGNNTYTGGTVVNGGVLDVDGSVAATTVNVGGTLTGSGTVGDTQINPGGVFAPGSGAPGSSMTVAGNLAFQSGAIYLVQLNSTTASFASVSGSAALAGTVRVAGSYSFNSNYTILTSSGLNGTRFDGLAAPAGIAGSLSYTADTVQLKLTSALGQIAGLNANQRAVGTVLDAVFNAQGNSSGPLGTIFSGNVPQNLTQAAGETATGSQQTTFSAMNQFMGVMTDPFAAGRGEGGFVTNGATGYADEQTRKPDDALAAIYSKAPRAMSFEQRWSVWAAGFGGSQTTDGNATAGSSNTSSSIYGTAVGADYRVSPDTLLGFALAGGGTNFSVTNGGSGRSDLFQAGAFARHTSGPAYISAALAYGWQDVTTDRTLTIAGIDRLRAAFNANAWSGRLEGGYRFVAPWTGGVGITPYAAGQFTTFDLPAYAESALSGANTFALSYAAKSVTDTRSELGIRSDKSFAMQDGVLTLRGRAAWAHDYDPNRAISASFQALPGASFVVNGAAQASDSALVTASAEMKWINGWSAAATFEGEFSNVTESYAGKGVIRYAW